MSATKQIDQYIAGFPAETQLKLQEIRAYILEAAPHAEEVISYGMPAIKQGKVLVYYAGYKNHIGFYPTGTGIAAFQEEIAAYKNSKGAVQFPLDKKIPKTLVQKMVKFKVKEVQAAIPKMKKV